MSAVLQEQAQFRSVDDALRFYTRFNYEQYERPADMVNGPRPFGRGLGGLDGAGTLGLIGAQMATLPQLWRRLLIARHVSRTAVCECEHGCCSGWKYTDRFMYELKYISETVFLELQLPLLKGRAPGRDSMVCLFYKEKNLVCKLLKIKGEFTFEKMATSLGMHRNTLSDYNSQLSMILKREEKLANGAIEERLMGAQIVGE